MSSGDSSAMPVVSTGGCPFFVLQNLKFKTVNSFQLDSTTFAVRLFLPTVSVYVFAGPV